VSSFLPAAVHIVSHPVTVLLLKVPAPTEVLYTYDEFAEKQVLI
jgi:hypothetical protein